MVAEQGANRLTIDAVAAQSGFSKGGVLYHFATKNALLVGMLEFLVESHRSRVEDREQKAPLVALIEGRQGADKSERRASLALLTAFAEDSELLVPVRKQYESFFEESVESAEDQDEAAMIFFANEGMRFLELLDVSPLSERTEQRLNQELTLRAENLK